MTLLARMRLLQIASQAFPIGGYSHSQGLEAAVDAGIVTDEPSLRRWITDVLAFSMGSYELHCLQDMSAAWRAQDGAALREANQRFLASRESAELRSATVQMGFSMRSLLAVLPGLPATLLALLDTVDEPSLPCLWSGAASAWCIDPLESMAAYAWSWAENQVLAAVKSVPLGQSAGQRVLLHAGERIATLVKEHTMEHEHARSNFAPSLAILCAQHETQYSRLFRS
jgi:urease accessory protein